MNEPSYEPSYEKKIEKLVELHKAVEAAVAAASAYAEEHNLYYWVHSEGDFEPWEPSEWSFSNC